MRIQNKIITAEQLLESPPAKTRQNIYQILTQKTRIHCIFRITKHCYSTLEEDDREGDDVSIDDYRKIDHNFNNLRDYANKVPQLINNAKAKEDFSEEEDCDCRNEETQSTDICFSLKQH